MKRALLRIALEVLAVVIVVTACGNLTHFNPTGPEGAPGTPTGPAGRAGYITHKNMTAGGGGPTVYRLRVAGDHGEQTVEVSARAYDRCGLGGRYPACAGAGS
jgi:hypothetical protein